MFVTSQPHSDIKGYYTGIIGDIWDTLWVFIPDIFS